MKKSLISAVMLLAIVMLMAWFNFGFDDVQPISINGTELVVCPAKNSFWDAMSAGFMPFLRYIEMIFFFGVIVVVSMWAWALYQNLLKDEFKKDAFSTPWEFTKILFWAAIVMTIVLNTPNRYRRVSVQGMPGEWVLCENTSQNATVVNAGLVHGN